jgi:ribosomal protein S18 acetylase RimI-like enzyme
MVSLSALDQERFGIVTARDSLFTAETLTDALRFCQENAVQMLVARCTSDDLPAAQAMEKAGGRLMDTLVYYARDLDRPFPEQGGSVPLRLLRPGDSAGVCQVAAESFRGYLGHYHADPLLDRAKCDEVYVSWAERSCLDRAAASTVLVAEDSGRITGFLTILERSPEEQEIILNGVDPAVQRRGIYRALVLAAMSHAQRNGARRLTVSTQLTNTVVQRTWTKLGFEPFRSYYTFHLWFDRGMDPVNLPGSRH